MPLVYLVMVTHWQRLLRHDGDYFERRRRVIRRCLVNIHAVVESSSNRRISVLRLLSILAVAAFSIAMLAAIVAGINYRSPPSYEDQLLAVRADHRIIRHALESFHAQHDRYPSNSDGIPALLPHVPATNTKAQLKLVDPWGNPYEYRTTSDGNVCTVLSWGADGQSGGREQNADVSFSATKHTLHMDGR